MGHKLLATSIENELKTVVGPAYVLTHIQDRALYAYDATIRRQIPMAVIRPRTTDEVSKVMALADSCSTPVSPRGASTGLSGGSVPLHEGWVIDLSRMQDLLDIHPDDLYARVGAGVTVESFARAVQQAGLFFPPDPGSAKAATMGGSLAENAGGPHAFKYGVFRDYVLGLTVVLADGRVLHTGGLTVKNVSGYDLTRLFVGSEGTLGIITEATMRLISPPEDQQTLLAIYDSVEDAAETVSRIIAAGMQPAALEFIDDASIRVVESYLHLGLPLDAAALLLIEVDGPSVVVEAQARQIADFCRQVGARSIERATTAETAAELWRARKAISSAVSRIKPSKISEDATVPRSQIPAMVRRLKAIAQEYNVHLVIFGHIGDGNLHPNIVCDENDEEEMARVWAAVAAIFDATLELGGTLTGEHGIGYLKAPFMPWEHDEIALGTLRKLKFMFDPKHLLNPGKIFPEDAPPWPVSLESWRGKERTR